MLEIYRTYWVGLYWAVLSPADYVMTEGLVSVLPCGYLVQTDVCFYIVLTVLE